MLVDGHHAPPGHHDVGIRPQGLPTLHFEAARLDKIIMIKEFDVATLG